MPILIEKTANFVMPEKMTDIPQFPHKNESFTEDSLFEMFGCAKQGGIRHTKKHNRVLLIDSTIMGWRSEYYDEVDMERGFVIYNGTGEDDQSFDAGGYSGTHNKKVKDVDSALLYFIKSKPNHLEFMFPVKYISHSYGMEMNRQLRLRRVIKFKLKILRC